MTNDIEFNRLRNQAFEKLKTDRRMFSYEDINDINNIILDMNLSGEKHSEVIMQIFKDTKNYKIYDALAMWLDLVNGLAKYEPELIKRIAIEVGGLKGLI